MSHSTKGKIHIYIYIYMDFRLFLLPCGKACDNEIEQGSTGCNLHGENKVIMQAQVTKWIEKCAQQRPFTETIKEIDEPIVCAPYGGHVKASTKGNEKAQQQADGEQSSGGVFEKVF